MRIVSRRAVMAASSLLLLACTSTTTTTRSSSGCGGSWDFGSSGTSPNVQQAPTGGDTPSSPPGQLAPTGQAWKPTATDEGCGRSGIQWVLVDEVCSDGEGTDPRSLEVPMFRDGALVGDHLLTVDATHLWSLDLSDPTKIRRSALLTGVGQPLSVQASGSRLFVAAGLEGLVVVDAADPASPARVASLDLPHAAFDVALHGASAYVAMGKAGVAAVDVAGAPTLSKVMPAAGYAAGVAADDAHLFVAACTSFSVLDRATGAIRATVPFPKHGDRLLAPAKDVALVGDVAFVAAGSQGAVAVDISTPTAPKIIGRCGVDAPSFYASGVRAENGVVFVAGGEWGVLRVDASDPKTACKTPLVTAPPSKPAVDCSTKPPWEVVDWERVWSPPPPGRDPIQVLPAGERLYAFGDARRIGVRAVDVRASSDLAKLGRYDEPRALVALAGRGTRLVAAGTRGGAFTLAADGTLTREVGVDETTLTAAQDVAMLSDQRFVALDADGHLRLENATSPLEATTSLAAIDTRGMDVFAVSRMSEIVRYGADGTKTVLSPMGKPGRLPLTLATSPLGVFFAAPEWVESMRLPFGGAGLTATVNTAQKAFDASDIMDAGQWRVRVPRRHLAGTSDGAVELAALGSRASLLIHRATSAPVDVILPAVMTYAGLTADATHAYAIGLDRGLYRSYLVTVALTGTPHVVSLEAFTGAASGVVALGDRVVVADADGALRTFSVVGDDVMPVAVTRVEVKR
ncbi:MAG: hypothetical protein JST00_44295 [Deltaproteobacteria bacterium]|nr:hypothetical protein [Deltaproteobacteria bacterium]